MSEQTVAAQLGNTLFGSGVTGALEALGSAYELAFAKGLSQLSSPGVSQIVDRTGHVGVTREIANYKVSLAIADQLAARIATESDPRVQEILKVAAAEFQGFAHAAGSRIVQASAYSTPNTTVEEAVAEIFEASPDFVASLLEPTPGAFASADAIADAAAQLLAEGMSVQSIVEQLQTSGVGSASQSMTDLSLSLEAHLRDSGSAAWHTIAAQAGGSALLQTALFESGYVPGLEVNAAAPFWEDAALAERVRALLTSDRVDFAQVSEYLPAAQALGWLVGAIDSDFSTEELNVLIDAAAVSTDGAAGVEGLVEQLEALLLVSAAPQGEASELGFYRSVFATIHDVQAAYPEGLDLESLATQRASALAQTAARETEEGLAYRYALTELNGFAVIGADYERFNANGELDLYDQASGEGAFTAQYLADRPELLAAMLYANLNELAPDAQSGTTYVPGVQDVYLDRDAGLRVSAASGAPAGLVIFDGATDAPLLGGAGNDRLYGEQGNDQIDGGQGDDYVDGGAGADQLAGGAGRDVVMGGLGDDSLLGNSDGDLLDGGAGYDEYRIGNGDVVRDADGSGRIVFVGGSGGGGGEPPAGIVLLGGMQVGDTSFFASDDGEVVYRENEDASVDFWVEGRHAVVRPGAADLGPRARAADGSSGADLGRTEVPTVGRPGLGLPLTLVSGPRDLPFKAPFLAAVGTPAPRRDPLVLDLDGDGLEVLGAQAVTYFDHDANGFAELSGWVDADDGLLALDRNGDGRINHGGELFGDQTQLASGRTAASGAEALSEWDTTGAGGNADGRIDTADAVWSNLRVWRDRDSDGFADDGELLSMDQAGIASIGLDFETATAVESGNMRTRTGQFMRADGSRAAVGEYLLARDAAHTIAENAVAIDATAAALPEVRGAGNVYDLRQAMARAAELRDLVAQFGSEASVERRSELVDRILFRWAGADGVQPGSRGQAMDARQLATLEMFMGMAFSGALGGDPVPDAAILLMQAYHALSEQVYAKLMAQTHLGELYGRLGYSWDSNSQSVKADVSTVVNEIDALLQSDRAAGKVLLSEFARMLRGLDELDDADYAALRSHYAAMGEEISIAFDSGGLNPISGSSATTKIEGTTGADSLLGTAANDSITAYDGNDVVYGQDGDDTVSGCEGDDQVNGGAGRDRLFGVEGNDVLDGGAGDDYLNGGSGNDAYVLARGTGRDTVYDYDKTAGNRDVIRVANGIAPSEVRYWRQGNDLYVGIVDSGDSLRVQGWYADPAARVEEVVFADGTRWTSDLLSVARFSGGAGADTVVGSSGNDYLEGQGGSDAVMGGAGDDVLDGGSGDDNLYGGVNGYFTGAGAGNDRYLFGRGSGNDVIYDYDGTAGNVDTVELVGLNASDVTIKRDASSFYVVINDTGEALRVADWGKGAAYRVERVRFADGSVLEGVGLANTPFLGSAGNDILTATTDNDTLKGLGGNDVLMGGAGDDVLDGGSGNDTLYGGVNGYFTGAGAGNDMYLFGRGSGNDVIYDCDATAGNIDTVQLVGLNASDVTIKRDASSFYVVINDTGEALRVAEWGNGSAYRIERVRFADGSVLEGADLANTPFLGTAGADSMVGTAQGDVMRGLQGNDNLSGAAGDDVLDGGAGNDILKGGIGGYTSGSGAGNDTYLFGRGSGNDVAYDYDGTAGNTDTIKLLGLNASDVTIKRDASSFYLVVNDTGETLRVADWGSGSAYRIERVVFADGSTLEGAALANTPYLGTAGNDILNGTAENETMRGFAGNDTIGGGSGDDLISGDEGVDTLRGEDGNDALSGGAGDDVLYGAAGNDLLDGGAGADRMSGGAGDDLYWVDNAGNVVTEGGGSGNDTVMAAVSFSAANLDSVENITLAGSADLSATGQQRQEHTARKRRSEYPGRCQGRRRPRRRGWPRLAAGRRRRRPTERGRGRRHLARRCERRCDRGRRRR